MSDSEKLRKKQGNLWLTLSFFLFSLTICGIWITSLTSWIALLAGSVFFLITLGFLSIDLAQKAYKTYVGVSDEEISKSDLAKLKKISGISELVSAFIFLALAISTIWVIFVFAEIISPFLPILVIAFSVFVGFFYGCIIVAINNFIEIDRCVNGKFIKSKYNG